MLRISRRTDYSLRALIYLEKREGRVIKTDEMAVALDVPRDSFALALKNLSKNRLLRSFRGTDGGFTLGKRAAEITLLEIVEAVEGPIALNHCVHDAGSCSRSAECRVHSAWCSIQNKMRSIMDGITLEDMVNGNYDGE